MKTRILRRAIVAGVLATSGVIGITAATPAYAQFGGIVYDPTNYAQNVLTAARSLQQINNQIQQIQNQATSLLNEARNLTSLPFSQLQQLQSQFQRTQQLLSEAQRIAYDVRSIDQAFSQRYRGTNLSGSDQSLVADARSRWEASVGAFEDALKVQAGVVGNIDAHHARPARQRQPVSRWRAASRPGRQPAHRPAIAAASRFDRARRGAGPGAVARHGAAGGRLISIAVIVIAMATNTIAPIRARSLLSTGVNRGTCARCPAGSRCAG
jgi:conjugal transfer/entry exclusion protein